jgi:hypothetical protein
VGRPTKAAAAQIASRRTDAIDLRMAGVDLLTIGKKLAADPSLNSGGTAYPMGYGNELYANGDPSPEDATLVQLVSGDIRRSLAQRTDGLTERVTEMRELELARLDRLMLVAYRQAIREDDTSLSAIDRTLRIMERRARLLGLDSQQVRLAGHDGGPLDTNAADVAVRLAALLEGIEDGSKE